MEIFIKKATMLDLEEISELFNQYRVFYNQKDDIETAKNFIKDRVKNKQSLIFYAINNKGKYLGFTQLYPVFSSVNVTKTLILNDLYVYCDFRKLGIANELMNKVREYAIENNYSSISLETGKENTKAQSLYEKFGYKKEDNYYSYYIKV